MTIDLATLEGLSPLQSLLEQGFSKTTIARLAYLRVPQLKQWQDEMSFPTDTGVIRVKAVDNIVRELWKQDLPYDPVAFYESHVVLLEKNGKPYGAKLSHFFEISKWKFNHIVDYARSIDEILDAGTIAERYPATYKVIRAEDGSKAIVAVPGVELISASELAENWLQYELIA